MGVTVSGNAGPMNYRAAADFLALGTNTVQFCTVVEKHGYAIIDELMLGPEPPDAARGIKSIAQLVGITQPDPIRGFMDLGPVKQVSTCDRGPVRPVRQLHALPVPGDLAGLGNLSGHRRRQVHRMQAVRAAVLRPSALRLRDRTVEGEGPARLGALTGAGGPAP